MSTNSDKQKIGFAAIIFWDFVDEEDEDELIEGIKSIYGDEPQKHGGMTIGSGTWQTRVAGNEANEIEDSEEIASARTIIESNTRGILDVTTFAVLSDEQIQWQSSRRI